MIAEATASRRERIPAIDDRAPPRRCMRPRMQVIVAVERPQWARAHHDSDWHLTLRTEQSELDEILDVENPGGTLAVDDDDAVDLELLEQLHRVVQQAVLAGRHGVLRVADLAERLVEDRTAVALQSAAQISVSEDA